jgi:hypothetical protein
LKRGEAFGAFSVAPRAFRDAFDTGSLHDAFDRCAPFEAPDANEFPDAFDLEVFLPAIMIASYLL